MVSTRRYLAMAFKQTQLSERLKKTCDQMPFIVHTLSLGCNGFAAEQQATNTDGAGYSGHQQHGQNGANKRPGCAFWRRISLQRS